MLPKLAKIKGVHPGAILRRELNSRGLRASELALSIGEHKQTISAILNKRRDINPKLSIKLSHHFNVDSDYFMLLQASFNVKTIENARFKHTPDLSKIRKILFWDTTIDKIDWDKNRRVVIQRILERGNKEEINEIILFYGRETISKEVKQIKNSRLPSFSKNIITYGL